MKWFSTVFLVFTTAASIAQGHPGGLLADPKRLDERADVHLSGRKVSVITGIIMNGALTHCFGSSGKDMARGWAGALYDQWFYSKIPGTVNSIEALVSTSTVTSQFCITIDAVFTFAGTSDAQKFATFVKDKVNPSKRDETDTDGIWSMPIDVYVEGVDLPFGHEYFGSNTTIIAPDNLSKRGYHGCQNTCSFSFTNDQTSICNQQTFPSGNKWYC